MNFSNALKFLKSGYSVHRSSWKNEKEIALQTPNALSKMTRPYIYVSENNQKMPWSPIHDDLLGNDWEVMPNTEFI